MFNALDFCKFFNMVRKKQNMKLAKLRATKGRFVLFHPLGQCGDILRKSPTSSRLGAFGTLSKFKRFRAFKSPKRRV